MVRSSELVAACLMLSGGGEAVPESNYNSRDPRHGIVLIHCCASPISGIPQVLYSRSLFISLF